MTEPELHLFVIWPKARFAESRIMADLARETDVLWSGEMRFDCDMALAYRRFYGTSLPDERRKVANCGAGAFRVVVVRDCKPAYDTVDAGGVAPVWCNVRMLALKTRYREWAGRKHRVHGTVKPAEFARDVLMLTGRTADDWRDGVPAGALAPRLPDGWQAISAAGPFERGEAVPFWGETSAALAEPELFLENKYINDAFCKGLFNGRPAIEKLSSKAVWSIWNEYRTASRMYAEAPQVVPCPFAWRYAGDGSSARIVSERVPGPSLAELMKRGLSAAEADGFAADFLVLADALEKTGIVHRDLFADNFLLGDDGHLKAIDWQLAIDRRAYREDPWVARNWKFRYVVFGVNRELGLGVWNDFHAMVKLLDEFPQTAAVSAARQNLAARMPRMAFASPPDRATRVKLWLYAVSLRLQMMLRGRGHRKYPQLERRWRTVKCKWQDTKGY